MQQDSADNRPALAGIGEILWDVVGDSETLGGAPVNFAYHAGQLGAEAVAVSSVGDDERGDRARAALARVGLATDHVSRVAGVPTGYVIAELDGDGVATYRFPDDVAWDRIRLAPATVAAAPRFQAICFGTLAQRAQPSRAAIRRFLQSARPGALKVYDINLRQHFYSAQIIRASLEIADVVKVNGEELAVLADLEGLHGGEEARLRALVGRYRLALAVLTRGGAGSLLVSRDAVSDHPGCTAPVVDTIGAGDAFTAVTVWGLLRGRSLERINDHANRVAAYVCGRKGAMVELPAGLRQI